MFAIDDMASTEHVAGAGAPAWETRKSIITEACFIRSSDPGITLYMRNKRVRSTTVFDHRNVVLYVHGSPEPAETSLDLRLSGPSWMDHLAVSGFDVYFVNLRGHGRSARLSAMSREARGAAPCLSSAEAGRDFAAAVDHVLRRRKLARLNLIGWSRGCVTIGVFAELCPDKVNKLVMITPSYPPARTACSAPTEPLAYSAFDRRIAMERWLRGVPVAARQDFVPTAWVERWWRSVMRADPDGARRDPPVYRGPLGWYQFAEEYQRTGKSFFYDPGRIVCPVLLVAGQWDEISPADHCRSLFDAMTAAVGRQFIQIGGGTHYMHREKVAGRLIRRIVGFLAEP